MKPVNIHTGGHIELVPAWLIPRYFARILAYWSNVTT
jgi:hypothetical protein